MRFHPAKAKSGSLPSPVRTAILCNSIFCLSRYRLKSGKLFCITRWSFTALASISGFLFAKLGLVPDSVFCTLTASRLLANGTNADNDLAAVLRRYLAIDLPKDQGGSDWGAMILTDAQLEYARNDVLYLHPLKAALEGELAFREVLGDVVPAEVEIRICENWGEKS
jgi:hypothetical protein